MKWRSPVFTLDDLVENETAAFLFKTTKEHGFILFRNVIHLWATSLFRGETRYTSPGFDNGRAEDPLLLDGTLFPHVDTYSERELVVWYKKNVSKHEPFTRLIPYAIGIPAVEKMALTLLHQMGIEPKDSQELARQNRKSYKPRTPLDSFWNDIEKERQHYDFQSAKNEKILARAIQHAYGLFQTTLPVTVKQSIVSDLLKIVTYCPRYRAQCLETINSELHKNKNRIYTHTWQERDLLILNGTPEIMHQKLLNGPIAGQTELLRCIIYSPKHK